MKINLPQQPFIARLAYTLLSLLITGYLIIQGKRILSPLVFACIFSILLLPMARFLEKKWRFRRSLAAATVVILLVLVTSGILYFLGTEISRLAGDWPRFKGQLGHAISNVQDWIDRKFHVDANKQVNYLNQAASKIFNSGTVVAGATIYSVSSALLFLSFTLFYTFFFILYRSLILRFLEKVFRHENNYLVHEIAEQVQFIIRKYITGMLIEMTIVACFTALVFSILGLKYAILLAIITGLLNVIPYIGILSAMIISSMITFVTAASGAKVIWVIIVLLVTHVTDVNILLPVIVGSKVKINAMISLLGIIIGELFWGIAGMFLSIPVIAVLKIIFDRVDALKPWGLLLGEEDPAVKPAIDATLGNPPPLEKQITPSHQQQSGQ